MRNRHHGGAPHASGLGDGGRIGDPSSRPSAGLTVLVPAYNEAATLADTIRSLRDQTRPPDEIIVTDDCSTDGTGDVARHLGVRVIRPPANTGSKAGAQNFALPDVRTEFVAVVDADTILAPDALEVLMPALDEPSVAAACGFVLPRYVRTLWERARHIEYLWLFAVAKQIEDYYGRPAISSGCFSVYRTDVLRRCGGWSDRTVTEDMDLTWTLYGAGHGVRFVPEAACYAIEPHNYAFMSRQLRRWSHGYLQNVRLHWRAVLDQPYLRSAVAVALWDQIVGSAMLVLGLPLLAIAVHPILLLGYLLPLPIIAVPLLIQGGARRETGRVLAGLPCYAVVRLVRSYIFLRAAWSELILGRSLAVYEKGH